MRFGRIAATLLLSLCARAGTLPPVQTVFIIVMENADWSMVKGSTNAPFINSTLLPMASYCEQYYNPANNHPSEPNYLWLEAGTNFGLLDDNSPYTNHQATLNHLVAQLQEAGISWKAYMEDISGTYVPLAGTNNYVAEHDPFVFFDDVSGTNNPDYAYGIAHIRPWPEFSSDLTNGTLARYNFITPNLCDNGHILCPPLTNGLQQVDAWLAVQVPGILASPAYQNNGALFVTWDEGQTGDGPIGMIVLSPLARGGGYFNEIHYTHSSTLRTMQEIFGVGPLLGDAANAEDLSDLFTGFLLANVTVLPGRGTQLTALGVIPGGTNIVLTSTNLAVWTAISTNTVQTNTFTALDQSSTNAQTRFYRLVQLP